MLREHSDRKEISMVSKREYTEPTRKGCKRCGSKTVAWQTGSTGKWYLTEVFEDAEGRTYTEHTLFHSPFCKGDKNHDEEQARRISEETKERKETIVLRKQREDREAAEEAKYFLELHDLCKDQREVALDELAQRQRELDSIRSQPTTMDYMVEHMRELARVKRLTTEIAFMKAALGMGPVYDDE